MSTANFKTMSGFPLVVAKDEYVKVCPECGACCSDCDCKCPDCGADLSDVDTTYDEIGMDDMRREMEALAEGMNDEQRFFTVSVESGYYSGLQFYVECKYGDVEDFTNDDARYEFGVSRSKMLREYESAMKKIRRGLEKAREELGLVELDCIGRFSNGEAIYQEVA